MLFRTETVSLFVFITDSPSGLVAVNCQTAAQIPEEQCAICPGPQQDTGRARGLCQTSLHVFCECGQAL